MTNGGSALSIIRIRRTKTTYPLAITELSGFCISTMHPNNLTRLHQALLELEPLGEWLATA